MRNLTTIKLEIEKQVQSSASEISIIELVDLMTEYAFKSRASDIHIEPGPEKVMARFRIDGILHDSFFFPKIFHQEVISRIKVLSGLKTDIHFTPQDGRFKAKVSETQEVDIRVSIAPTYYGENCVMRILAETAQSFTLEDLGFSKEQMGIVDNAIKKPYGMILVNGPTGSGKTTSLYTILKKLSTREISVITIEDPIEYSVQGITQMPVSAQAGLTFATGLRSILRQDPNIIMVGEIRDQETAGIAVNAALTGHLVLSTLHTNDAATTFPRLIDMEVPSFLVASTINIVIAQRLVRIVCYACRKERILNLAEIKSLGGNISKQLQGDKFYAAGPGCEKCDGTGYQSRIGIHEVLEINEDIRSLIVGKADAGQIKQMMIKNGMKTMIEDGLEKAHAGITTIEEVIRIIYE